MTAPAAFAGSYADIVIRKTRSVFVVSVEFPLERYQAFVAAFGGPAPGAEIPVALARLAPEKPATAPRNANGGDGGKERRAWGQLKLAEQAGVRCEDREFQRFICEQVGLPIDGQTAAMLVRRLCGVDSRSEITPESNAGVAWVNLDAQYLAWRHEAPIAEPVR